MHAMNTPKAAADHAATHSEHSPDTLRRIAESVRGWISTRRGASADRRFAPNAASANLTPTRDPEYLDTRY